MSQRESVYESDVQVRLLGPFEVTSGDDRLPIGGSRPQRLLLRLALEVGRPVSRSALIVATWGDDLPRSPGRDLRVLLSRLRTRLGERTIGSRGDSVVLTGEEDRTDAAQFERLRDEGQRLLERRQSSQAARNLLDAIRLWRGPFASPYEDADFVIGEAARLEELRLSAHESWIQCLVETGHNNEAVAESERLLHTNPFREAAWSSLMIGLYRMGRQAEALRAYRRHSERMIDELGTDASPALQALELRILQQDPTLDAHHEAAVLNETPPTETDLMTAPDGVTGRNGEIAAVIKSLDPGVVTIVGPGGIGKTTLARAVAQQVSRDRPVWFVDLTKVENPSEVLPTVFDTVLGEPGFTVDDAVEFLVGAVLILDNCEEHAPEIVRMVESLTDRVTGLAVLATSRIPLGMRNEKTIRLAGLVIPDERSISAPDDLHSFPATELLLQRSGQVVRQLDGLSEARGLVRICQLVGGVPLGLELAAGLLQVLRIDEVERRISEDLGVLEDRRRSVADRHRTLVGVISTALGSLTATSREVMDAVAIAMPGASVLLVEHMTDDLDVIRSFDDLVGRGLVLEMGNSRRFTLTPHVRSEVRRVLSGDRENELRRRHFEFYKDIVDRNWRDDHWLDRKAIEILSDDLDNVIHAIRSGLDVPILFEEAAKLFYRVSTIFEIAGAPPTTGEVGNAMLESAISSSVEAQVQVKLAGALVLQLVGEEARSIEVLREASRMSDSLNDPWYGRVALNSLGAALGQKGAFEESNAVLEALLRSTQDIYARYNAQLNLGFNALEVGLPEKALSHFELAIGSDASLEHDQKASALLGIVQCRVALDLDIEETRSILEVARSMSTKGSFRLGELECRMVSGLLNLLDGEPRAALRDLAGALEDSAIDFALAAQIVGLLAHAAWNVGHFDDAVVLLEREAQLGAFGRCVHDHMHEGLRREAKYAAKRAIARSHLPGSRTRKATLDLFRSLAISAEVH